MFALGNEIPPGVVRWHGRVRVEQFLRDLYERREGARRPTACSPTSTSRRPSSSTCRSSTSARSTSTCTARPSCARTSRGCSTSPATSRCCSPRRAPTASARARTGQAAITAMHVRAAFEEGAVRRGRVRVDRRVVARRPSGRGLGVRPRRSRAAARSRRRSPWPRRSRTRRFRRAARRTWPRVSVVVCAYNAADTLEDCLTLARAAHVSRLRDHPRQRRLDAIGRARSGTRIRACASSTSRTAA